MSPVEKPDRYPFIPESPNFPSSSPFFLQRPPAFRRRSSGAVRHLPVVASLPLPPRSLMASGDSGGDASGDSAPPSSSLLSDREGVVGVEGGSAGGGAGGGDSGVDGQPRRRQR